MIAMRFFAAGALVAAQLLAAAQPAIAAELDRGEQTRMGVFGGLQVRMPIGGARSESPRVGLAIAPTVRSERLDGTSRSRIGEGLQLGLGASRRAELSLAGTRIDRLGIAPQGHTPDGRRAGVSTLGWIGIGVGVAAIAGAAIFYAMLTDDDRCCE